MKVAPETRQLLLKESTLFPLYRWVAWLVAVVVFLVPGTATMPSSLLFALLMFTAVLNMLATVQAREYVRIARRRPWVLLFDGVLSLALLGVSGSAFMAFVPYASGALLLPALILPPRQAIAAGVGFMLIDQVGLTALQQPLTSTELAVRSLAPVLLVLSCIAIARIIQRTTSSAVPSFRGSESPTVGHGHTRRSESGIQTSTRRALSLVEEETEPRQTNPLTPPPATVAETPQWAASAKPRLSPRAASGKQHPARPSLRPATDLPTRLNRLVDDFRRTSGDVALELTLVGTRQDISPARQMTLVKLAQAALTNVRQHAHAHSAWLTLTYAPQQVTLLVADDGVGLMDGTHERPGVHTLRALQYCLAELDGSLEVMEGERGGVTVCGSIPLES